MSSPFLEFLENFAYKAQTSYYLDDLLYENKNINSKTEEIYTIADAIHPLFQVACLEMLKIDELGGPPQIVKSAIERKNIRLEGDLVCTLKNAVSLGAEEKPTYTDIAKDMMEKIFVPLTNTAKELKAKLDM